MRILLRWSCRPAQVDEASVARLMPLLEQVMAEQGSGDLRALWTYVTNAFPLDSPLRQLLTESARPPMQREFISYRDADIALGLRRGRLAAETELLLHTLDRRSIAVPDAIRRRIEACTEHERLRRWFDRALTATDISEVVDPSPGPP